MHARLKTLSLAWIALVLAGCETTATPPSASVPPVNLPDTVADQQACLDLVANGFRPIASEPDKRFNGKVGIPAARCRGGEHAVDLRGSPFVDWSNYHATGDASSLQPGATTVGDHLQPDGRGIDGALLDLEYQRMELVKFNLYDNNGTYGDFKNGRGGVDGPALKTWDAMRLLPTSPEYVAVGGAGPQLCRGELIRFRNLDGTCNDIRNPRMGSTGTVFARNVSFDSTYPDLGNDELARNRHGSRLSLLQPDPQVISRKLFTRAQSDPAACNEGEGLPGFSAAANCDYKKAPFFNVLAAFWIQFMTHDWFSHLEEGHNEPVWMPVGCTTQREGSTDVPLTPEQVKALGCRPDDRIDKGYIAQDGAPPTFTLASTGQQQLERAYQTHANNTTGWWDASQLYGYDTPSRQRVKRDPADRAKMLLLPGAQPGAGEAQGDLPTLLPTDPMNPQWAGQSAVAFPDNWTIGIDFYHTIFAREHNAFVTAFHAQAVATPDADSGLRDPAHPEDVVRYRDVSDDVLFEITRLVVAAEIAKIHTIEWTPQLLYDEPLYLGMNSNWHGLLQGHDVVAQALEQIVVQNFGKSEKAKQATQWYSVFASGPGIFGLGSHVYKDDAIFAHYDPAKTDIWDIRNPDHVNGGVNHFGSPFNFPEEFVSVYRLHALVPDLIEFREWQRDPNVIRAKIPVVETFRAKATAEMADHGAANWGLSMGRQRLGLLTLQNTPQFMQNLTLPRLQSATQKIDLAALDVIRDREHGVPRFNEFRRQYGLRQLTSYDDFIDHRLPVGSPERRDEERVIATLREVYGTHVCDASKVITAAQLNPDGTRIDDCLGHPDGSVVDNIEDVDTVVGWLSEFTRPHGYAISETQFQVFILNASRRLFSDRFFTSSFRPEFYSTLGVAWVSDNGPLGKQYEAKRSNGHVVEVSPLKRVLLRTVPELKPELDHVVNVFDPWGRDRGDYYTLSWQPRPDAAADPAFAAP